MRINREGLDLLKSCEGCELAAYPDPGTGGEPWTIGYGHTGVDVRPGLTIDAQDAEDLLINDLMRFEDGVEDLVTVDLTGNASSALVSFAYNVGLRNLEASKLLRFLNAGDFARAADEFPKWCRGGGRVLPGLVKRRAAERELFLTPGDGTDA